jgi:small nuclear ribonucleoprotein (snRNP)-like protein
MKLSGRVFTAALLLASLIPVSAYAKPPRFDWTNVQNLNVGSKIVVVTKRGEQYEGELKHVDADSLLMLVRVSTASREAIELRRENVSEIRKHSSRAKGTLLGLAIGLGAGLTIGAISDSQHNYSRYPNVGKGLFGAMGAGIGLALGRQMHLKGQKIYVAP